MGQLEGRNNWSPSWLTGPTRMRPPICRVTVGPPSSFSANVHRYALPCDKKVNTCIAMPCRDIKNKKR